jgi:UDP-glucose 4-epimerase
LGRALAALLESRGWKVYLTRTNDTDLALTNRVALADQLEAGFFLSLHFNSSNSGVNHHNEKGGLETYCLTPAGMPSTLTREFEDQHLRVYPNNAYDAQNVQYAVRLHRSLVLATAQRDRGVRRARFMTVLQGQNRPAVLIEGGYLSDPKESRLIATASHRQKLAEAVARALNDGIVTDESRGTYPGDRRRRLHRFAFGGTAACGRQSGNGGGRLFDRSGENLRNAEASSWISSSQNQNGPNCSGRVPGESVYHLAAAVGVELVVHSPIRTIRTNLDETEAVLQAAAGNGRPRSPDFDLGGLWQKPKEAFDEEDDLLIGPPHLGRWSYACSKLMDEFLALAYAQEKQLPVIVARLFNTVGPRQTGRYGMVLPRFIAAAKAGEALKVHGNGKQTRCFCYVADTVEALIRLQNSPKARGEVFNVGSTDEISIADLANEVIATLGSNSSICYVPYETAYAKGFQDMLRRRPVIEKAYRTVGFRPATRLKRIIELTAGLGTSPAD